jgi:nucleoside-diphosphate-sugar epimerase
MSRIDAKGKKARYCGTRPWLVEISGNLMNPQFRVIIIGGTGQVGSAVVQALLAESACREVVMVTREAVVIADPARQRNVVMDTGAADFEMRVADLAREVVAGGDRVSAVSCVGVGSGSSQWTEEQLKQLEIGVVGAFARGVRQAGVAQFCLQSAVGANAGAELNMLGQWVLTDGVRETHGRQPRKWLLLSRAR